MKYVVTYSIIPEKSAYVFDSHDEAVRYINNCSERIDPVMDEMNEISNDHWSMKLKGSDPIDIEINSYAEEEIKYHLRISEQGKGVVTRRFSTRENAVKFASDLMLEKYHYSTTYNEDQIGTWSLNSTDGTLKVAMILTVVILHKEAKSIDPNYEALHLSQNATIDEAKAAFRYLSKKYHPDMPTGNPKKFAAIKEAYDNIVNSNSATKSKATQKQVKEEYSAMDARYFFSEVMRKVEDQRAARQKNTVSSAPTKSPSGTVAKGILELFFGGILTAISYNSASSNNGTYFIYTGLLVLGIWNLLYGIYLGFKEDTPSPNQSSVSNSDSKNNESDDFDFEDLEGLDEDM